MHVGEFDSHSHITPQSNDTTRLKKTKYHVHDHSGIGKLNIILYTVLHVFTNKFEHMQKII